MIELPEAITLSRQLNETLTGKRIRSAVANQSPHGFAFYFGNPGAYPDLLDGRQIGESRAYGGRVVIEAEDACLHLNDGANLRYLSPDDPRPQKHQLLVEFDDGSALYVTVSMYAGLLACPKDADLGFYANVAMEKPSPLSANFDAAYFARLFDGIKPSLSAKALLATEQRIPGLGNGTLQDILFEAQIHPKSPASKLSDAQRETLFQSVKSVLSSMTELGGRDTEKSLFGQPGGYRTRLSSKTWQYQCPRCGGSIVRQAYLGGNVYFCAGCQRL